MTSRLLMRDVLGVAARSRAVAPWFEPGMGGRPPPCRAGADDAKDAPGGRGRRSWSELWTS